MKTLSIIAALVLLLTACAAPAPRPASSEPEPERPAPPNPGKELGRKFLEEARKQYRFVKDPAVVDAVNGVGRRLVTAAGADPDAYHFFVVSEIQPNAFAIPGGYIFIFDGLLAKISSEEELAGVLAHEIGHVTHNHFFKDDTKVTALTLATIAAILLSKGSGAAANIGMAATITAQLQFSRENEEEADASALRYLQAAGYDPSGMLKFFKTLLDYERIHGIEIPAYLGTHPALGDRIHLTEMRLARSIDPGPSSSRVTVDWDRVETIIRAKSQNWKEAAQLFPERAAGAAPDERFHYLSGLAYLTVDRVADAIAEYGAALAVSQANPVYHADLAMAYLKSQEIERAGTEANESLKRSKPGEEPLSALLVLGVLDEHAGRRDEALRRFEAVIQRAPEHAFAHYHAGQIYFQSGKPLEGAYHTALYLRANMEPEAALQEFKRAKDLAPADSDLARKIREQIAQIVSDGI